MHLEDERYKEAQVFRIARSFQLQSCDYVLALKGLTFIPEATSWFIFAQSYLKKKIIKTH